MKLIFVAALVATGYSAACTVASGAVAAQGAGFVSASAISGSVCTCAGSGVTAATPECAVGQYCVQNAGSSPTKGVCQTAANYAIVTRLTTATGSATCAGSGTTCGGKKSGYLAATSGNCGWHGTNNANGFLLGTVGWYGCMSTKMAASGLSAGTELNNANAWAVAASPQCTVASGAVAAQGAAFVSASAIGSGANCVCGSKAPGDGTAFPTCIATNRCVQNAGTSATKGFCQTAANYASVTGRVTATNAATCAGTGTTCGGKKTTAAGSTSGNCLWASGNTGGSLLGTVAYYTCMQGKMGNSDLAAGTELNNANAWAMAANPVQCTIASSAVTAQGGGFVSASALTTACICGGTTVAAATPICTDGARCVQDLGSSPTKGVCQTAANYALITSKTTALTSAISSACTGSGTATCGGILTLAQASASATGCKWHTSTLTAGSLVGTVAYWDCVAGKLRAFAALSGTAAAQKTAALNYAQAVKSTSAPSTPTTTVVAATTTPASIASIAAAGITAVVAALL